MIVVVKNALAFSYIPSGESLQQEIVFSTHVYYIGEGRRRAEK